jgi:hypothetical protein
MEVNPPPMNATLSLLRELGQRSWKWVLAQLSTSTLSLILSGITPIVTFVISAFYIWHTSEHRESFLHALIGSFAPLFVTLAVTGTALAFLFVVGFLVTISNDYASMRSTISAHEQEVSTLQQEMSVRAKARTTMNRDWPGDWRLMEDAFRRHAGSGARAFWQENSFGDMEFWSICGDNTSALKDIEELCVQCGTLLEVSPAAQRISERVRSQPSDRDRWLLFLKERYGLNNEHTGWETVNGNTYSVKCGDIEKLAAVSASGCVVCAAMTFRS